MDKTQATPLPWIYLTAPDGEKAIYTESGGYAICDMNGYDELAEANAALIVQSVNLSPYYERMRDLIIEMSERLDGVYGGKNNIDKDLLEKAKAILRETEGK